MPILAPAAPVVRPRFTAPRYVSWQEAMKDAVRDVGELCRLLELPDDFACAATKAGQQFPLFAPRGFVARMKPSDPSDPLLRQVLPTAEEMVDVAGFSVDPVGDRFCECGPGLLRKYH